MPATGEEKMNMSTQTTLAEAIRHRYSCRHYEAHPIPSELQDALGAFLATCQQGPFGTRARFRLVAANEEDRSALKGLGTYGFIKDAPGFLVGAVEDGPHALEDFGVLTERIILYATRLGLGTCWLGGSFSKSGFAKRLALTPTERMPAVVAIGLPLTAAKDHDRIRRRAGGHLRLPIESLFFGGRFGKPLSPQEAEPYAAAMEAVRWAPSASNKQPWRIVRDEAGWHFFLERTKGYGKGSLVFALLRLADLQRVDIGIAMCHFEVAAQEAGMDGAWIHQSPSLNAEGRSYIATWRPGRS